MAITVLTLCYKGNYTCYHRKPNKKVFLGKSKDPKQQDCIRSGGRQLGSLHYASLDVEAVLVAFATGGATDFGIGIVQSAGLHSGGLLL